MSKALTVLDKFIIVFDNYLEVMDSGLKSTFTMDNMVNLRQRQIGRATTYLLKRPDTTYRGMKALCETEQFRDFVCIGWLGSKF